MDRDELLSLLRDIHEPVIPLWQTAEFWAVLAAIGALTLWWAHSHTRFNPKRAALRELALLDASSERPTHEFVAELNLLLHRFVHSSGDQSAARLYGDDWLAYLEHHHDESQFTSGTGTALAWAPYVNSDPPLNTVELTKLAKRWISRASGFVVTDDSQTLHRRLNRLWYSLLRTIRARSVLRDVHRICLGNDATRARLVLIDWFRLAIDERCVGLEDIARHFQDDGLSASLRSLDASIYGENPTAFDGGKLWNFLDAAIHAAAARRRLFHDLPSLYS